MKQYKITLASKAVHIVSAESCIDAIRKVNVPLNQVRKVTEKKQ